VVRDEVAVARKRWWPGCSMAASGVAMYKVAGLQNTSMYSVLRVSARLFKFGPFEFSMLRCIQAAAEKRRLS
jgi:hypothetical protein